MSSKKKTSISIIIAFIFLISVIAFTYYNNKNFSFIFSGKTISHLQEIPSDPHSRAELMIEYRNKLSSYSLEYIENPNSEIKDNYIKEKIKLDNLINAIKKDATKKSDSYLAYLSEKLQKANQKLLKIETSSQELSKNSEIKKAKENINGEEYKTWKTIYSQTINEYLNQIGIKTNEQEKKIFAKEAIKQKALQTSKEIEIYIKSNPEKTLIDLQNDPYFQDIAVQKVGKTGYTAVTDYNTLICRFHSNPKIINLDLKELSEKLPGFWSIMFQTKGGYDSEGFYDWIEKDNTTSKKYMYIAIVNAKTKDGVGLSVAATTYIDEYSGINQNQTSFIAKNAGYFFLGFIIIIAVSVFWLIKLKIIELKGKKIKFIYLIAIIILLGFAISSYLITSSLKSEINKNIISQNKIIGDGKINEITNQLSHLENHLEYMAKQSSQIEINSSEMDELLKSNYELTNKYTYAAYRIDNQGIIKKMYPLDKNSINADISSQEHMIEIKKTQKPVISGVFDAVEGFKGITIHDPVIKNNQYDGTVAYLVNLDQFIIMTNSLQKLSNKPLYLYDQNKNLVYSTETNPKLNQEIGQKNLNDILNEKQEYYSYTFNSKRKIAVDSDFNIRGKTWHLIITDETEPQFKSLDSKILSIFIITLITIICLIIIALIMNNYLNKSLKKEVKEKTKELASNIENLKKTKTALLNMMEDMDQANEDLKKLDKAKSEFLNMVSHELKTPLTAIIAYLDIIKESNTKFSDEDKMGIEVIKRNANSLKQLIGNILEIARMESGKFSIAKRKENLTQLLKEVIEDTEILAKQKGIKINLKSKNKLMANVDPERIKEVFTNLISNSIKFTDKGSIDIELKKSGSKIIGTVKDTGVGIPKEKINNLFQKFYQVDASLSRKYGGTGLGLSITKRIIKAHNGTIKVSSKENKGTSFTITLPIK